MNPSSITTLTISSIAGIPCVEVIVRLSSSAFAKFRVIVSDSACNRKIQARSPSSFSLHASLFSSINQQRLFSQLFFVWPTSQKHKCNCWSYNKRWMFFPFQKFFFHEDSHSQPSSTQVLERKNHPPWINKALKGWSSGFADPDPSHFGGTHNLA